MFTNICAYKLKLPSNSSNTPFWLCGYYSKKATTDEGRHIAHYPECEEKNCPLVHINLIEDAKNKKWDGKKWV